MVAAKGVCRAGLNAFFGAIVDSQKIFRKKYIEKDNINQKISLGFCYFFKRRKWLKRRELRKKCLNSQKGTKLFSFFPPIFWTNDTIKSIVDAKR